MNSSGLNGTGFNIDTWKWAILAGCIALGLSLRPILVQFLNKIKNTTQPKFQQNSFWFHLFELPIEISLSWIATSFLWVIVLDNLFLPTQVEKYGLLIAKILLSYHSIRFIYLSTTAVGGIIEAYAKKTDNSIDGQMASFATKTLRILVLVLGCLLVLQNLGINVTSLLAGLGIGGLALALAAQDTAANLFGSITIIFDSPFKLGDWVKIGDLEGTVEEVGFRSTRIRTFYNSLVTIPNSIVAKEKIDNMRLRPFRRIRQNLGISYETPPDKIDAFCENLRYMIQQHENVIKETIVVTFDNFLDSSLNIMISFHVATSESNEEIKLRQQIYCNFLKIAAEMKVEFAFPTQTVYYRQDATSQPQSN